MAGHGVGGDLAIDWPSLMAFKRSFTDPVPAKQERRYAKLGVDAFHGLARFASPDAVAVDGRTLQAQHLLIATEIGSAHVCTPVTNAHLVCRLRLGHDNTRQIH